MLPVCVEGGKKTGHGGKSIKEKEKEKDGGHRPSFCVLLHGSLKIEKMGALVKLRYPIPFRQVTTLTLNFRPPLIFGQVGRKLEGPEKVAFWVAEN